MSIFRNLFYGTLLVCLFVVHMSLVAAPLPLSFQYLSQNQESHDLKSIEDKFAHFSNKNVEIRGFLYKRPNGEWILSSDPNLATCCVGSHEKVFHQILVKGEIAENTASNSAVTLEGNFVIAPNRDKNGEFTQLFVIENSQVIKEEFSKWFITTMGLALIGIASIFLCRMTRNPRLNLKKISSFFNK